MTQLRTGLRWGLGLLVAVGLLGVADGAQGQEPTTQIGTRAAGEPAGPIPEIPPGRRTFGIADEIVKTYDAWTFTGNITGNVIFNETTGGSFRDSPINTVGVDLPAGSQILRLELDACDTSNTGAVGIEFIRANTPPGTGLSLLTTANTGVVAMPGCQVFEVSFPAGPFQVNNAQQHYFIRVFVAGSVSFSAVRVFYRLQVSPAPAVATFSDVPPSHPFFQFVEALAASGITVGCGCGNFCPDAALTRGQLAVFLSRGLGLHFAP
jgi:hypothetical protein